MLASLARRVHAGNLATAETLRKSHIPENAGCAIALDFKANDADPVFSLQVLIL